MAKVYYSTTTFLTLAINRHLYGGKHFVYVADGFYAYGSGNPKSSNPLLIYTDLYQPWKDADPFDKFILQHRLAVRKGILARERDGTISSQIAKKLKWVADRIRTEFFYPVVYELDIDPLLKSGRAKIAGSGLKGSKEYLILDLDESEFKLLFDNNATPYFTSLRNPTNHFSSHAQAVNELLARSP